MTLPVPADFADWCGWYDVPDRPLLVTQVPESSFGEPMILVSSGDLVQRFYAVDDTSLRGDDGTMLDLRRLTRSSRYREKRVRFDVGSVPLAGTVITPATPGPHPAAVFVHGAAGGQRDFNRLFAQPFLDAGVAVLIYDKAGHGLSGGTDPTIFDQRDAASAAMDVLIGEPDIAADRIGLAGVSNGMWSVPMVAARRSDVAFLIGIGSPGVSMGESEEHRRVKVLRDAGVSELTLAAVARAWRCIFAIAASGTARPEIAADLHHALDQVAGSADLSRYAVPDFARENPMLSPIPPLLPVDRLVEMLTTAPDPELTHDPVGDYRQVGCPVFLQFGADDSSVPVATSAARITRALDDAAVPHTIEVYPHLEHLLNEIPPDQPGSSREAVMYAFHGFRFGPGVRQHLTDWLTHHRQIVKPCPDDDGP